MSRFSEPLLNPNDPNFNLAVAEAIHRLSQIVDSEIEFGDPQDPTTDEISTLAGDGHNGRTQNIAGSWVELQLDDATNLLNTNVTCTHNLGLPVLSATEPNVRWETWGWQHDNTGAGAGSTVSAIYTGGSVTSNAIQLRFFASGRTVTAAHPLKVCLRFIPATYGIAQQ